LFATPTHAQFNRISASDLGLTANSANVSGTANLNHRFKKSSGNISMSFSNVSTNAANELIAVAGVATKMTLNSTRNNVLTQIEFDENLTGLGSRVGVRSLDASKTFSHYANADAGYQYMTVNAREYVVEAQTGHSGTNSAKFGWTSDSRVKEFELINTSASAKTFTIGMNNAGTILPVELIAFSVEKEGQDVLVQWSTATEKDNEAFDIQFSKDGIDFEQVTSIAGQGTTDNQHNYEYRHSNIGRSGHAYGYYRLKQRDFDGTYDYSDIRIVGFDVVQEIRIFPNPLPRGGELSVIGEGISNFKVYDVSGKLKGKQVLDSQSNATIVSTDTFTSGLYIIVFEDGRSERFIVN